MIGVCRKILDVILLETKVSLTHEFLSTFLVEVCTIVNVCPLVLVCTDLDVSEILTPAALLPMKTTPPCTIRQFQSSYRHLRVSVATCTAFGEYLLVTMAQRIFSQPCSHVHGGKSRNATFSVVDSRKIVKIIKQATNLAFLFCRAF